jgi:hypothetical protein
MSRKAFQYCHVYKLLKDYISPSALNMYFENFKHFCVSNYNTKEECFLRNFWILPLIHFKVSDLSLGVKGPGHKADHSPPSSAVKNVWSYTSTLLILLHGIVLG